MSSDIIVEKCPDCLGVGQQKVRQYKMVEAEVVAVEISNKLVRPVVPNVMLGNEETRHCFTCNGTGLVYISCNPNTNQREYF